jgi:hypothetical protein
MKTSLKFGLPTLALFANWSAQAQELAVKVAAAASGASGPAGGVVDRGPPNIVWFAGGVALGFVVGYAVASMTGKSAGN